MRILFLLALFFTPLTHAEGLLDRLPSLRGSAQPEFLPPDQAFGLELKVSDLFTDCLSVLLQQSLQPVTDRLVPALRPEKDRI